jgi:cell division septation protein DedD
MARDNDDRSGKDNERPHGKLRQEPTFSRYNEDDDYEEPDRDADYASGYHVDDDIPEDEFDDNYDEDDEPDLFSDEEVDDDYDSSDEDTDEDDAEDWPEEERFFEEEQARSQTWPLGLIAVAVIALILLAAGGYGVMQQRTATENELRELRAALATTGNPRDASASRDALEAKQAAFEKLATETEALRLENRALSDTVAGLQAQLGELRVSLSPDTAAESTGSSQQANNSASPAPVTPEPQAVASPKPAPKPQPKPAPKPAPKPQPAEPVVSTASGPWFVNFGSYAMREMAQSWASRLRPAAGEVAIIPISSEGRTLYRLRVIGLADRETAQQVARKLETDLQVSKLWVGAE